MQLQYKRVWYCSWIAAAGCKDWHLQLDVAVSDALLVAEVQRHDQLLEKPARQVLRQAL